jgi:hypothetical protein
MLQQLHFSWLPPSTPNKRAGGTNGCHERYGAELDLISILLKYISTPFDF